MIRIIFIFIAASLLMVSCASIPKETVNLSEAIGNDLERYHNAHSNTVKLYYDKIKTEINKFIDDVYAPYIIHYVLKSELEKYQNGEVSFYQTIILAATDSSKQATNNALTEMFEMQTDAYTNIATMRNELLEPVLKQEKEVLNALDLSYQNTINANTALIAYLSSARKVKENQKKILSVIGLNNMDTIVTDKLVELSENIDNITKVSQKIDTQSDGAYQKISDTINKIKALTDKK